MSKHQDVAWKEIWKTGKGKTGLLIAAAGLAMMGFGICRGEAAVVLEKAINICLECIGIG